MSCLQAAVEQRPPARPLWQDLLSDILPDEENISSGSGRVSPQPAAGDTGPANEAQPPEAHVAVAWEAVDTGEAMATSFATYTPEQ